MALNPQRPSTARIPKSADVDIHKPTRAVVRLSVDVPQPLMRELKIRAAADGITIQSIILRLLNCELSVHSADGQPAASVTQELK